MNAFLLYIARAGLYLGIFYAFYILVMRRTTFFRFNRAALLAGSLVCVLLPLLRLPLLQRLPPLLLKPLLNHRLLLHSLLQRRPLLTPLLLLRLPRLQ